MMFKTPALESGQMRTRWRFALFPTRIDRRTVVWLESYRALYMYAYAGVFAGFKWKRAGSMLSRRRLK